jgi:phosphohistidine phosphatase
MGQRLKEMKAVPQLLMSSPAKRALSTAEAIARELGYPKKKIEVRDELYEANIPKLLKIVKVTDDSVRDVMLFGHNPEFTNFANYLSPREFDNIPTCGILCLDFNVHSWKKITRKKSTIAFFEYPKKKSDSGM